MDGHRFFVPLMSTIEISSLTDIKCIAAEVPAQCTFNLCPSKNPGRSRLSLLREVSREEYETYLWSDCVKKPGEQFTVRFVTWVSRCSYPGEAEIIFYDGIKRCCRYRRREGYFHVVNQVVCEFLNKGIGSDWSENCLSFLNVCHVDIPTISNLPGSHCSIDFEVVQTQVNGQIWLVGKRTGKKQLVVL